MATIVATGYAQEQIKCETYLFATHEDQELYLDLYRDTSYNSAEARPCMIFVFGGGFAGGERDHDAYKHYFHTLAREGIAVASIDYRLGLKGLKINEGEKMDIRGVIAIMQRSVNIAVEDLYAATEFIISNASEWNIDTTKIMVSGSSAGAITALQAEWCMCNGNTIAHTLPHDFRYAAVVACAGAIFSTEGKPKWDRSPAPTMLFHGTSDSNVPYNKASIFGIGFYGSKYIVRNLEKLDTPYYFYTERYADHALAIVPLIDKTELILQFIKDYVMDGRALRTTATSDNIKPEKRSEHFSAMDYLKTNYTRDTHGI